MLQPFERSELRIKTAMGYSAHRTRKSLSPSLSLADSARAGAKTAPGYTTRGAKNVLSPSVSGLPPLTAAATWWKIVDAQPGHIQAIADDMRAADVREVWASHRHTPAQALAASLERSELAWTCIIDDVPAFMWGAARKGSLITYRGAPWLLGTPAISQRRVVLEFLRQCPAYVARMQARFPRLENYVHAQNRLSIRWLRWLGFTVETAAPVVIHDDPFFVFWRDSHV